MEFCGDDRQTPSPPRIRCKKEPVILSFFFLPAFIFAQTKLDYRKAAHAHFHGVKQQKNNNVHSKVVVFLIQLYFEALNSALPAEGILYAHTPHTPYSQYTVFTNGGHAGKNWCLVMKARRWRINKICK